MAYNLLNLKDIDFSEINVDDIVDTDKGINSKDIAIIGVAGRFAGCDDLDAFWQALVDKKDCVTNIPDVRKNDILDFLKSTGNEESDYKFSECAYLNNIDLFDYDLFSLSPKEASLMSPDQRLFLETAWQAIEDSGYGGEKLKSSCTGVYIGYSTDFGGQYKTFLSTIDPSYSPMSIPGNINSIVAGRISYILDLKGPGVTIDTACSSALFAVHMACQGIRNGECDMALAGGIKINYCTYGKKTEKSAGIGIYSSNGRTKAFDDSSDGTGIGEGAGVILLKSLGKSLNDGDSIYAVIKGSAINQNGSSVGITAPNAAAQEDVIIRAWKEAGINPETITYLEAHGTGTKLGDPIEFSGIKAAFEHYTNKKQFCAVGSVKSNIGHLDNAAGIAGLIKCILALKHGMLPPTVHFSRPNRKIDFEDSPIYVNDKLKTWDTNGQSLRCGVSAFGLGGANSHVVLEEAPPKSNVYKKQDSNNLHVLALSAKNKETLLKLINNYLKLLNKNYDLSLESICYTTNTGRGHYSNRVAFIIKDLDDLKEKLQSVIDNNNELFYKNEIYYGEHKIVSSKKEKRMKGEITEEERDQLGVNARTKINMFLEVSCSDCESVLKDICSLYIGGAEVNWDILYSKGKYMKMHLPTYPFDRKRCWVELNFKNEEESKTTKDNLRHPLLNNCLSESYDRVTFQSKFSVKSHWVLNEHKVEGIYVVPGTTYLEMVAEASKKLYSGSETEIKDVVFIKPLTCSAEETKEVQTIINKVEDFYQFVILSKNNVNAVWEKHAEGSLKKCKASGGLKDNISQLKELCRGQEAKSYSNNGKGVETGPRWACVEETYYKNNEILALISLPIDYLSDLDELNIHPSLMDVSVNMAIRSIGEGLYLPWKYKNLRIYGKMPARFYSHIKRKDNNKNLEVAAFDIKLMDEDGSVFMEIENYYIKKVHEAELKLWQMTEDMFYEIGWRKEELTGKELLWKEGVTVVFKGSSMKAQSLLSGIYNETADIIEVESGSGYEEKNKNHYIIRQKEEDYRKLFESVKGRGITGIIHMMSMAEYEDIDTMEQLADNEEHGIYSLFNMTRAILECKLKGSIELVVISDYANEVTKEEFVIKPCNSALFGLARVIGQEYSNIHCRCIDIDDSTNAGTIISGIKEGAQSIRAAYRGGIRYIEEFGEADIDSHNTNDIKIKDEGVYVITGGTGGIGLEIARYLATRGKVNLALISRSILPDRNEWDKILLLKEDVKVCEKIKAMREIEAAGAKIELCNADISIKEEIGPVLEELRKKYGRINGIIHGAGVAGDGFIIRKNKKVFADVINPKIKGAWNLDRLTRNDSLDFFVMFSSVTAILGGPGQGDYTGANAFLDSYSAYMNKKGRRALAINWPAWKETGMAVDHGVKMDGSVFMGIGTKRAIRAFDIVLNKDISRVIAAELNFEVNISDYELLKYLLSEKYQAMFEDEKRKLLQRTNLKPLSKFKNITLKGSGDNKYTETERELANIWGNILDFDTIDIYDEFTKLGGNSIVAVKMETEMEGRGLKATSADIYEHTTIKELAAYIDKIEAPIKFEKDTENIPQKVTFVEENNDNIKPFNELFYKHCFYNSLFPVLIGFKRDISSFLFNDIIMYSEQNENCWWDSNIFYQSHKQFKNMLDEMDISVSTGTHTIDSQETKNILKLEQKKIGQVWKDIGMFVDKEEPIGNFLSNAIEAVNSGIPVIIWVDCFYESIRNDTFNKIHWPHSLLLYGYNEEQKVFKAIEHDYRENLTYEQCVIGVDDVINSYCGFIKFFQINRDMPTYFKFSLSNSGDNKHLSNLQNNIYLYKANIIEKRDVISAGLDVLKKFIEDIKHIISNEYTINSLAEQLINSVNQIINSKYIEKYRISKLFDDKLILLELINDIIDCWLDFRNDMVKYTYSLAYNNKTSGIGRDQLDNICRLENEYVKSLIEFSAK